MSEFIIDTYYDITCSHCSRKRSIDFEKGKSNMSSYSFETQVYTEGWRVVNGKNVCPYCDKLLHDPAWVSVGVQSPPINTRFIGISSKTDKRYHCFTKEGHTIYGYIYSNDYSCSGYAVQQVDAFGDETYYNNVTHWVPDESVWGEDK